MIPALCGQKRSSSELSFCAAPAFIDIQMVVERDAQAHDLLLPRFKSWEKGRGREVPFLAALIDLSDERQLPRHPQRILCGRNV
jgi:hypothetical protein